MGLRINQNIAAMNAYRNLSITDGQMSKSLEKLSSGFRINRAADDAAGLTKSEGLRSEIRGTNQAIRNAQDGVSFVQTAEGALNEVHSIMQRMRELAVSAANGTNDGAAEQAEFDELINELDAIGTRTNFAGTAVFDDYATTAKNFHVGANAADTLAFSTDIRIDTSGLTGFISQDISALDLTTDANAALAITALDTEIGNTSTVRSTLGATQNRLEHTIANLSVAAENLTASESRIRDTDMAQEMMSFTRAQILSQAGTAMLAQANQAPQGVLQLLR